ncbi:MAG TPA: DUF952 domain-containing protein [Devosiaceae bacterium]|nr:DUF952 domain-containing protein [Devosiaceae bacterium]
MGERQTSATVSLSVEPIFKVITLERWRASTGNAHVPPMPVDIADGYLHFSTRDQLTETLRRHFAGRRDLVLLAVDPALLGTGLTWERSRGGDRFPHLYAPCPLDAVLWHAPLTPAPDGGFVMPEAF